MRVVVTGAAGFIGSHLCERLVQAGNEVTGVDCFTDHYDSRRKRSNVATLLREPAFTLHEVDLLTAPLEPLLDGVEVVYHLAGQPGVRPSWGQEFATYTQRNLLVTQRLLEASCDCQLAKFVYASSSSVYGDAEGYPTREDVRPQPVSPYGVTKLAAEHLCELYRTIAEVPTVSLRLFTVYGPRQRPDMAFFALIGAALTGSQFVLFGDGNQTRDFTYVDDVVAAMTAAAQSDWTGVANVGGGARTSMLEVIDIVADLVAPVDIVALPTQRGDVRHTAADTAVAHRAFGYSPRIPLREGLARMVQSFRIEASGVASRPDRHVGYSRVAHPGRDAPVLQIPLELP
jgi:nucleoside-diphosphate-sugar epimerase